MTNYTQKKKYAQNTTTKTLGLNVHTRLRAGEGIWEGDFGKMFSSDDNGLSPQQCPLLSAIASQLQPQAT